MRFILSIIYFISAVQTFNPCYMYLPRVHPTKLHQRDKRQEMCLKGSSFMFCLIDYFIFIYIFKLNLKDKPFTQSFILI